jgi:hypothetical protein
VAAGGGDRKCDGQQGQEGGAHCLYGNVARESFASDII